MINSEKERQLINDLFINWIKNGKSPRAYCTTTTEITMKRWNGKFPMYENMEPATIAAGTTLRISACLPNKHIGLNVCLDENYQFELRLDYDDPSLTDFRLYP